MVVRGRRTLLVGTLLCAAASASKARAQTLNEPRVNLPYVSAYGIGVLNDGDARINVLTIPVKVPLRRFSTDRWGLRLRLTGSFGVYRLDRLEDLTLDRVRAYVVKPGLELQIPLGPKLALIPYLDAGVGRHLEHQQWAFVGDVGVRSEFVFPWQSAMVGIVPRLAYSTSRSADTTLNAGLPSAEVVFDLRHPLWFHLGRVEPDVGIYFRPAYSAAKVDFEPTTEVSRSTITELEGGVSLGSCPPLKLWFIPLPRISVGYRWSNTGISGVRITLGDRLLRCQTR